MSKGRILVTGGLGFIGSHTVVDLLESGYDVISIDNLLNSNVDVISGIAKITGKTIENINCDLSDSETSIQMVEKYGSFDGIIHFAALKSVGESVFQPARYYQNNVGSAVTTMMMMDRLNIPHLIFSSSCTVYGSPEKLPVTEDTPMARAENPYGASKQACEILYEQYFKSQLFTEGKTAVSLRYFNPAGAHLSAMIGESSRYPPTNLVPVITETAAGIRKELTVHGDDYPTRDGSCVRDYIHVMDLARAHTLALEHLLEHKQAEPYEVYNLGIGEGVTVLEALHAFESSTGVKVNYEIGPRRTGDVAAIYADNSRISKHLQWRPTLDINAIMKSAWEWEKVKNI